MGIMGPKVSVLIADDHPPFAQGLSKLLLQEQDLVPIGIACDGQEAVRLARELRPDVVVMDISMPNTNGIEATTAIKSELPNTAILMLSAYGYYPYVISALDAGAGGYLMKTVPMRELIAAIRALKAGETVLEHSVAEKLLRTVTGSLKGETTEDLLTEREIDILKLSAHGLSNREIGQKLNLAERTIQAHLTSIFSKFGVGSRLEAVLKALKSGWITMEDLP